MILKLRRAGRPIMGLATLAAGAALLGMPADAIALMKPDAGGLEAGGRESADGESGGGDAVRLAGPAPDSSYGRTSANPVRTGGGQPDRFDSARRYLTALFGPKGERVQWRRIGSCCHRDRPSLEPVDMYEISGGTLDAPVILYLDPHTRGEMLIPSGLTSPTSKGPPQ